VTARLTTVEAAGVARRHPVTVRYALQDGTLHGTQRVKGGRWLIDPECLAAWVENRKCEHQLAVAAVPNLADRRAARASA
jgi:hypothetical protein